MADRHVRLLSIDGGGVRGIIPAVVLNYIETQTGKRTAELFDLIAGTSTGGLLALLLGRKDEDGRPMYSASQCLDMYLNDVKEFFSRTEEYKEQSQNGRVMPKYPADGAERTLKQLLGDAKLSDACTDVLVTAYELRTREARSFTRRKALRQPGDDFYMRDLARATTAFPSLMSPARISNVGQTETLSLSDGGLFAINPTAVAIHEAAEHYQPGNGTFLLCVSLGTGEYVHPIDYDTVKNWGYEQWSSLLTSVLFDAQAQTTGATADFLFQQIRKTWPTSESLWYSFQIGDKDVSDEMDDTSPEHLQKLKGLGESLVEARKKELDSLCELLVTGARVEQSPG